ncbi:hypothetical protein CR513_11654, partial [Mucuna pruriens]
MKVDQVLEYFNNDDYVKVMMVTYEFSGYALKKTYTDTWFDLRKEMRTRFVPASYTWGLYNNL